MSLARRGAARIFAVFESRFDRQGCLVNASPNMASACSEDHGGKTMGSEPNLERYLHRQIPLSAAMRVSVLSATAESVTLGAPLEPNINHKSTVFGGSASAVAILAAWSLVHLRLLEEGRPCEIVIQSNHMDYDRPITGPFTATSSLADVSAWPEFLKTLTRRKRARVEVQAVLTYGDAIVGRLKGRFVAFLGDSGT